MKAIKLIESELVKARDLIKTVLESPQKDGLLVTDIRERCKLLDKLEASVGDTLVLEDAEYNTLKNIVNNFRFAFANKHLLEIIDAILSPENIEVEIDRKKKSAA